MNLLEHFYRINAGYGGLTAALGRLNQSLGSNYRLTDLGQWKRGDRPVPLPVQAYMRAVVIRDIQQSTKHTRFTSALADELISACEPPSPRPMERFGRFLVNEPQYQG